MRTNSTGASKSTKWRVSAVGSPVSKAYQPMLRCSKSQGSLSKPTSLVQSFSQCKAATGCCSRQGQKWQHGIKRWPVWITADQQLLAILSKEIRAAAPGGQPLGRRPLGGSRLGTSHLGAATWGAATWGQQLGGRH